MYKNPQAFYDKWYGKSVDVDGAYGAQCWDAFAKFCIDSDVPCSTYCALTGYAGDLYKLRYDYGYDKWYDFFYPKNAKRGDWIFWDKHVAMVWDVYSDGRVLCFGQNQGGKKWFTLKTYDLASALGCMRWKGWITFMDGWVKEGKHWCYYREGKKVTGWQYLEWSKGHNWFYFTKDGVMLTSWQELTWSNGKKRNWFYFESSGAMVTGLRQLQWKGAWDYYYFDETSGAMQTGNITLMLEFNDDGALIGGKKV